MVASNIILLSQIAGYAISSVLSLCVAIPLAWNFNDFDGHCILNTDGHFNDTGKFIPSWASPLQCISPFILSVLLTVVSLYFLVKMIFYLRDDNER